MDLPSTPAPLSLAKRNFWQRRLRDPIIAQLTQGIGPEKIALTIAVGAGIALFPLIGTTTLLCFLAALIFRLNQPLIHLLNQAFWPIHIPAIYGCIRLGEWMFGSLHHRFSLNEMTHLFWHHPTQFWQDFGHTVLYATVAWAVTAPILTLTVYFILLPIMRRIAQLKAKPADNTPAV